MKMEQTGCPKTSAYKIQTPGNYPKENIQHTEHAESLKSRIFYSSPQHSQPGRMPIFHHVTRIWQNIMLQKNTWENAANM